jgi:predicted RNA-binding Zn ribbon-like protein
VTAPAPFRFTPEAPADVQFLLDFVNTRPVGRRSDCFADAGIASAYLRNCGFDVEVSTETVERIRHLRDVLADALGTDPGDPANAYDWRVVNALAAQTPVTMQFEAGNIVSVTGDDVVARVLADVQAAMTSGRWSRLHLCANDVCRVGFYDATRSRTQRWHSYETCGNRVNVAAHRARKA